MKIKETHRFGHNSYVPGDYWMVCDECGLDYRKSEMKKRWDNAWVCKKDWEPKHPQEFVRGKTDNVRVPVSRPVQDPVYIITPITPDDL